MKKIFAILAYPAIAGLVLFGITMYAQTPESQPEVKLTLRDGSIFNGSVNITTVILETDYGKLTIPLKNVSAIDVGITPDKANEAKIIELVKQLSAEQENNRKSAYEQLVKMSVNAVPVIRNFMFSDKYQPATYEDYTADKALKELETAYNLSGDYSDKDVVTIDYLYTMGGFYTFKDISIKTEYGQVTIPKEKIQRIDVTYVSAEEGGSRTFILQASKHISSNQPGGWLKTGIMVKQGQKITMNASGKIILQSLSGGIYTPDGAKTQEGGELPYDLSYDAYPQYGNLVYKIGENGTVKKAGSNFNGTADATGMLFLSIFETVYNANNTGSYNVKVKVE